MTDKIRSTIRNTTTRNITNKVVLTDDLANLKRQVRRFERALDEASSWMTINEDDVPSSTISMDEVNHLV